MLCNTLRSTRSLNLIGLIIVITLLGFAFYIQAHEGLNPCPLCVLQRISMGLLGALFFIGAVFKLKPCGAGLLSLLSTLTATIGVILAGRQVFLQHLPSAMGANCDVGFQYLFKVMPFFDALQKIFAGGAECAQVGTTFLYLSLAEWSLLAFIALTLLTLFQLVKQICRCWQ